MAKFKIVKVGAEDAQGNSKTATANEVFGFLAFKQMNEALTELMNRESVDINGNIFFLDEKVKEKLEGIQNHIAGRWNHPIKPERIEVFEDDLKINL